MRGTRIQNKDHANVRKPSAVDAIPTPIKPVKYTGFALKTKDGNNCLPGKWPVTTDLRKLIYQTNNYWHMTNPATKVENIWQIEETCQITDRLC
jgi:hypothetical protein